MSQFRRMAAALVFAVTHAVPARSAEDQPAPPATPPGVLVEPRRPDIDGGAGDTAPADRDRRDNVRPGCPANDRPLELLV